MKIVLYVDYSNPEFNSDFRLSNKLISDGHNVFLAINDNQFLELKKNCDRAVLGCSAISKAKVFNDILVLDITKDIDFNVRQIV